MLFHLPRSLSPLGTWVLPSGLLSYLIVLLPWAQTLTTFPLKPRPFTCWAWLEARFCLSLALCPGYSSTPAGLPSHPASRGQQAPDHKDPLLAGAPVNVQRPRNWHSAWSDLQFTLGKGTMEDGAPLFPATAGLQPRKENSFSGHICPFVAPPHLHIKTPGTPTALV